MSGRWFHTVAVAALIFLLASAAALVLVRPSSPLAAADRLFERIAWNYAAPPQPQSGNIVIVAITDETLARFPYRSPIDRGFIAQTITALEAAGVRAIGIDILFDQPTEPAKDAALAAALDRATVPIVLIGAGSETPLTGAQRRFLAAVLSHRTSGLANLSRERLDDAVRIHVPVDRAAGRASFPSALAAAVGAVAPDKPFPIEWRVPPSRSVPAFPVYPAEAVASLPPAWLAGRIALIGTMIPGEDEHRTMLSAFGPPSHGVEIHAHVLSQMLDGRATAWTAPWQWLATLLATAAAIATAACLGSWAMISVLVALVTLVWAGPLVLFALQGPLLTPAAPTLGLALASGGVRFWRGRRDQRDRNTMMQLFARFVSEPVVTQIWSERETFLAGGRPRPHELVASVLFCDIAGFTPICESLEPAPLIAWLDRYIDAMVEVVMAHEGIVLRFIGDGILAVFGAPFPRLSEDEIVRDARNAVACGIAMHETMRRLNAEWCSQGQPSAGIRIGIHTGPLVAGSLGNGPHMEYCLLGDTANTAARLEALGKQHLRGGPENGVFLVGEPTWRRLGPEIRGEPVGEVALKGKERKVAVYRIELPAAAAVGEMRAVEH